MSTSLTTVQQMISDECDKLKVMLLDKNARYGNSAISPIRVFSQADNVSQILIRMDDKLSRIKNMTANNGDNEDAMMDLAGYIILYKVAKLNRGDMR